LRDAKDGGSVLVEAVVLVLGAVLAVLVAALVVAQFTCGRGRCGRTCALAMC